MRGQRKNPRKAVQPFENKKRKIDIFKNYEANGVEKIQRKLEIFSTLISKKSNFFNKAADRQLPGSTKEKARKLRRKECHEMKRPAKLTLRAEDKGFGGKTIFRTARGWVDAKDLTDRTPAEELAKMREEAQEKLTYLKNHPAPQFYHVYRPLLDISSKNPTRIKLAQKAILINMTQHKESWDQAAARFVQEQQDFAHSEYACTFDKDCSENQKGNLRMAYYIHTATPKNVKAGALPCEISKVPGCRNFTN